jgi:hypothetical protein
MLQERRQFQRLVPDTPGTVSLSDLWSGRLLDLSEGGLAIEGAPLANQGQMFSVAFQVPGGSSRIQATAEVAWTSETERRTGLRFLDLAVASREQLRRWISARVHTWVPVAAGIGDFPADAVDVLAAIPAFSLSDYWQNGGPDLFEDSAPGDQQTAGRNIKPQDLLAHTGLGRLSKLSYPAALILAMIILTPASIFVGYLLGNGGFSSQASNIAPISNAIPAKKEPLAAPATTSDPPGALPLDAPGFVLQVGAMIHEDNADTLRATLEEKHFPALVFKRSNGRYFTVAVGPYRNTASASKIKSQLEAQGFEAIVVGWTPQ